MKKKEFEEVDNENTENIKMNTLELSKADMLADSRLKSLESKNELVISLYLTILCALNLVAILTGFYDIVNARHVIPLMLISIIIVSFVNCLCFKKSLKNIILKRYIDRIFEKITIDMNDKQYKVTLATDDDTEDDTEDDKKQKED